MKKYIIILLGVIFFISCQEKNEKTIESVKVWYYNGIFESIKFYKCDDIVYLPEKIDTLDVMLEDGRYLPKQAVVLESVITDKEILQEIAIELHKQKVTERCNYPDVRMKCYLSFSDGQIDSLCTGNFLTTCAVYNEQPIELTNKLIYLIRKNCGFYWWIGADYMKYFDELNDTTFVREKVKSRWGGEY
jgi:hypothetical protein